MCVLVALIVAVVAAGSEAASSVPALRGFNSTGSPMSCADMHSLVAKYFAAKDQNIMICIAWIEVCVWLGCTWRCEWTKLT